MVAAHPLPDVLRGRPFTSAEAHRLGVSRQTLRGRRVVSVHRGVHRYADTEPTTEVLVAAAMLALPPDAVLSHTSALWWHGATFVSPAPLHFSVRSSAQTELGGVVLHRRIGRLSPDVVRGVPVLGADRTLVDCGTILNLVDLVRAGDWLVRLGLTSRDQLARYVLESHLDGVLRMRRASALVRDHVDSITETDVRLMLVLAGLPEPHVNAQILDDRGAFLARGDLVYPRQRVLIEYDGWHHERDAAQRQKDHLRRERLEAAGWRVIVVTAEDLKTPISIVSRVHQALVDAGYPGQAPLISNQWKRWFVK